MSCYFRTGCEDRIFHLDGSTLGVKQKLWMFEQTTIWELWADMMDKHGGQSPWKEFEISCWVPVQWQGGCPVLKQGHPCKLCSSLVTSEVSTAAPCTALFWSNFFVTAIHLLLAWFFGELNAVELTWKSYNGYILNKGTQESFPALKSWCSRRSCPQYMQGWNLSVWHQ